MVGGRYHALTAWLAERRTDIRDGIFIGMSLDDSAITPSENCRYDLGIAFPQQPSGMLGEIVRSRGRATAPLSYRCRPSRHEMREALASAISSPSRSSPSTASETCPCGSRLALSVPDLASFGRLRAGGFAGIWMFVRLPEEIERRRSTCKFVYPSRSSDARYRCDSGTESTAKNCSTWRRTQGTARCAF